MLFLSFSAFSQDAKVDTSQLNGLREYPKKNVLPVRRPVLQIQPVQIPDSKLNLKVNYWRNWVSFGVNMNQASFSNNWKGGGVNSIAIGTTFNYKTDYTKDDINYVSEVILQYGKIKNKGQLQRKSSDRIYWDNKLGLKLSPSWNFFGSLNFESQFDRGFSYKTVNGVEEATTISRFMSPGYLTESLGFEYKPNKFFWLRIGTGTARQTFVLDRDLYKAFPKNYGVDTGKVFRNELAFQLVGSYERDVMENLTLKTRYTMFANYEKLRSIDQRLDLTLIAKVNRLVNVTVTGVALYDDDADVRIQASQTLALGLVYRFPN
ncbi:DUF3078 domain-containing protein [Arcticibacter sp. MXS-1]|uniref:DUF3078 domain-containing protein n=1 Tax=Arcticibacter sp. MXS-1 TaxID=3341726 RepID=UPI0035A82951